MLPILAVVGLVASIALVMLKVDDRLPFSWRRLGAIVLILLGMGVLAVWAAIRYGPWE